jgi:ATP-dependent DNA helicase HFM1/MER3
MLRTMNKSVRYPVKELVGDLWHKVYLIVQIHLSGLELPDEKDTNMVRRQLAVEKRLIFDRMNRLVRCIIDCKVFDGDSLGARSGLNLARALAANSWEAHPAQLQQVPGIGPVSMRKLVSHNVRSITDLIAQGFDDIERILRKNPPYGKNVLKQLDAFPRLSINAQVAKTATGRLYERAENAVNIIVGVQLMYLNRDVPIWNGRTPMVTLLLETTDGRIVSFWRSNIKKIPGANGLQVKFPAKLTDPDENISCYFSCEEIVGTEVCEMLCPNLPVSAFEGFSGRNVAPLDAQDNRSLDEFDDEDVADEDMLNVLNTNTTSTKPSPSQLMDQPLDIDVDFQDIEEVLAGTEVESSVLKQQEWAPVRLENGKWMCNHRCRGGELTKYGRPCTHKCCREGIDKPRPPPRKKAGESSDVNITGEGYQGKQSASSQKSRKRDEPTRTKSSDVSQGLWDTKDNGSLSPSPSPDSVKRKAGLKRNKSSMSLASKTGDHSRKKRRSNTWEANWDDDVELIDLCSVSEAETDLPSQASKSNESAKGIETPYGHVRPQTMTSPPWTKSKLPVESNSNVSFGSFSYDNDMFEEHDDLPDLSELAGPPIETQRVDSTWKSAGDLTSSHGAADTYKSQGNG